MPQIVPLRGLVVQHHLIISDDGVDLIDGGFFRGITRIKKALHEHGKTLSDVRSILLTHGHFDHTLNVAKLQKLTGCRVYAPLADRNHVNCHHRYQGWSRVAGWLEATGRFFFRFERPAVDHWFEPGETIHGLEVISLPGHTIGHCGFIHGETKLFFAGDLFTDHFGTPSPPPTILNDDTDLAHESIKKAAKLDLKGVLLNHSRKNDPAKNLESLRRLGEKL